MAQKPHLIISEEDIVYACKVLDTLAISFDTVAAQPNLAPKLAFELVTKSEEILDALLAVTNPDCRPVVFDLGKSALRLVRSICLQQNKKTPSSGKPAS